MIRKIIIYILIFSSVLLLTSCKNENFNEEITESPKPIDYFSWEDFDWTQFTKYLRDNEEDFINLHTAFLDETLPIHLSRRKTKYSEEDFDEIHIQGKGQVEVYYQGEMLQSIYNVIYKHDLMAVTIFDDKIEFQSWEIKQSRYLFFVYYSNPENPYKENPQFIDNWGSYFMYN